MANATIKYGEGNWAIGENIALAYNDTNERFKPLPFNFQRGSEATFVNRQGLIESTNTFGSEEITNGDFSTDSNWILTNNVGSSTNISGGTLNIVTDGAYTQAAQNNSLTSGKSYVLSYTVTSSSGVGSLAIVKGSSAVVIPKNVGTHTFYFEADGAGFAFKRGGTVIDISIDNVSVKEVTYTTNTPRIDFSNDIEGALLLEPQRLNEIPFSNEFSSIDWNRPSGVTLDLNATVSPDGESNASKLNATQISSRIQKAIPFSGINTISIFVKYSGDDVTVKLERNSSDDRCNFNVSSSGVVFNSAQSGIINYDIKEFSNDWYRISCTFDGGTYFQFYPDITGNNGSVYIYGAQAELGSYATSYIPTNGTPSSRLGEVCSDAGNSSFINSEEGVLYAEISGLANGANKCISISSGSLNDSVNIFHLADDNTVRALILSGSSTQASIDVALDITSNHKIAIKYSLNDVALWINGVEVGTDTNALTPIGMNILNFSQPSGVDNFYGNTKALQVFSEALSDAELQTLTTI